MVDRFSNIEKLGAKVERLDIIMYWCRLLCEQRLLDPLIGPIKSKNCFLFNTPNNDFFFAWLKHLFLHIQARELIKSMLLMSGPQIGSSFSYALMSRCVLLHLNFELSCSIRGHVFTRSLHQCWNAIRNLWKYWKIVNAPSLDLRKRRCVDKKGGGKGSGGESGDTGNMTNEFTEIRGAN